MTPISLVIFGASGDLTARKLVPSLYHLYCKNRLPDGLRIVGVARSPFSHDAFRDKLASQARSMHGSNWDAAKWNEFAKQVYYVAGNATEEGGLTQLQQWLKDAEGSAGGSRLYYLAVAPGLYSDIIARLSQQGFARDEGTNWRRLVIEKPFGRDLASAQDLNRTLHEHFQESQIYRIDHYLGKDTVQNILVFRFANTLFEPVWNHNYIDHVQITVSETVSVAGRGDYYEEAGVLRDMFQNHLLQLLALTAIEAPARFTADALRNEKIKVLDAIAIPDSEDAARQCVFGQYNAYRKEKGVAPDSRIPTYAAIKLQIDNWRWQGVPFYLRSGKCLTRRSSEIVVQFHCPPHMMFPLPRDAALECNRLGIFIQPDEGIYLRFQTKVPDERMQLKPEDLVFRYGEAYPDRLIPEAYERLLQDALNGDAALFMRSDEIERAWAIMDPFLKTDKQPPESYRCGTRGPAGADQFINADGRAWIYMRHDHENDIHNES